MWQLEVIALVEVRTRLHWGWTEPFLSDRQTLGTFPDLNIVVSCLTFWLTAFPSVPPCSFIACRPIHKFFFGLYVILKLPNCLEMFQSWKNASQSSFDRIWAQCFGQGYVSRPLPLNPTNSSSLFFFWTLLAKSIRLLEEKEFFPFQGKSLNPRKLGPRKIFNCHFILLRLYTWVGDFIDEIIGPSCSHQLGIALITLAYDQMMFSSCADDEKTCSFFYVSLGDNLNIVLLYNC